MRCVICGKKFEPKYRNQVACSDECRKKRKNKYFRLYHQRLKMYGSGKISWEKRKCKNCLKEFVPETYNQIYCSADCQQNFYHDYIKERIYPPSTYR